MLNDDLMIKTLADDDRVDELAAFHGNVFGPGITTLVHKLVLDHPQAEPRNWLYVEDSRNREIIAGLCLLPWELNLAGVNLKAGEMGIVASDERYRGRGLIRALNRRFDTLLQDGGYDISIIQGIPYFYRQFDYHYAMPLEAWCRVELHQFNAADDTGGYQFRPAGIADIPHLNALYRHAAADLAIFSERSPAIWEYLLGAGMASETGGETWLINEPSGAIAGYVRVMHYGFGEGLVCGEASQLSAVAATAVLHRLTNLARERGKPYVRLNLPRTHTLNQVAQNRGAAEWSSYAWQVRILNPLNLLQQLAPAFEQRLAASPFAGISRDLTISLYRQAMQLRFTIGKLEAVTAVPTSQPAALRIPPDLLAPLLFGWRSLAELRHIHPDVSVNTADRLLIDTLFPQLEAFLYSIY